MPPIKFRIDCRVTCFDDEVALALKKAGCVFLNIGFETSSQEVLDQMNKRATIEMNVNAAEIALKHGLGMGINMIWGMAGDTLETMRGNAEFIKRFNQYDQIRTVRPVTPYPGSPLYYDAIEMGLLDKDNPCEDFYENKHLNSDLICCNFTELSDEEFYECLRWANQTLMKNYFDRQRNSTLRQIDHLYKVRDASFRGFRHSAGKGEIGADVKVQAKAVQGNKKYYASSSMDGLVNWESSQTGDAERFSQDINRTNGERNSGITSFENYLRKKEIRKAAKEKQRLEKVVPRKVANGLKVENST